MAEMESDANMANNFYKNNKFKIYTPNGDFDVLAGPGFFEPTLIAPTPHFHYKTEIHIITGDKSTFSVNNELVVVPKDSAMIIPPDTLHYCVERGTDAYHYPFHTDYPFSEYGIFTLEKELAYLFSNYMQNIKNAENISLISSCISLIISRVDKNCKVNMQPADDNAFLVERFFKDKYSEDITLNDLSAILNLSPRQTERYVIAQTGLTFRKKLSETRIKMAKKLMKDPSLTMSEIAAMVGYKSYAGFWKALQKFD